MDLNPISPSPNPVTQDRATRRNGNTAEPPAPSPSNGVPPPVGDVIVVSDAARARLEAWEPRQGRTGDERRFPDGLPSPAPSGTEASRPDPDAAAPEA